jgi:hypothetical protein
MSQFDLPCCLHRSRVRRSSNSSTKTFIDGNDIPEAYERSDAPEKAMRRTKEQLQQLAARAQRAAALLAERMEG